MPTLKIVARVLFAFSAVFPIGCSLRPGAFVSNALQYNTAVEQANNKMLLLNIIRADQRKPMYLTDMAKLTGNIKLDISTGSELDLGGRKMDIGDKVTPGVDYALNPTFDVNVLATQEFMQGFLAPVSKDILAFYWEQDWPKDLLLHVFVQRVVVENLGADGNPDAESKPIIYYNQPHIDSKGAAKELDDFNGWTEEFLKDDPQFERIPAKVGPCISEGSLTSLGDLVSAAKEGFSVTEVEEDRFQLQRSKPDLQLLVKEVRQNRRKVRLDCEDKLAKIEKCKQFRRDQRASADCRPPDSVVCKNLATVAAAEGRECQGEREQIATKNNCETACEPLFVSSEVEQSRTASIKSAPEVSAIYEAKTDDNKTVQKQVTMFLRSPEAIIYYLGQLMRVEEKDKPPLASIDGQKVPIFVAFRKDKQRDCQSLLQVSYEGEEYIIPNGSKNQNSAQACSPGRSMQVLSIVNQLVALQKSAKDFPGTSTVRAIGQ